MKETIFTIVQLVLGVILIIIILLQQKGAGLSGVFGGSSNIYSTKRGVDKILHYTTVGVAVVFFGIGIARLVF
jgi:preprotein translocase subunit SecG